MLTISSRAKEQWAQCDDCSKWRKLPVDALLPPKWTCSENVWDTSRCSIIIIITTFLEFRPVFVRDSDKIFYNFFLWTCSFRSSCSAPDELSSRELENLLKSSKGMILLSVFSIRSL